MTSIDDRAPTAEDLRKKLAPAGAGKGAEAARRLRAGEAKKKALLESFLKPSRVSVEELMKRIPAFIERAVADGPAEVFVGRFSHQLCTDRGPSIRPSWRKH
jgi:hypothetical protein